MPSVLFIACLQGSWLHGHGVCVCLTLWVCKAAGYMGMVVCVCLTLWVRRAYCVTSPSSVQSSVGSRHQLRPLQMDGPFGLLRVRGWVPTSLVTHSMFSFTAGKVETTTQLYKYKMQLENVGPPTPKPASDSAESTPKKVAPDNQVTTETHGAQSDNVQRSDSQVLDDACSESEESN